METSTPRLTLAERLRLVRCRAARQLAERVVLPYPFHINVFVDMIAELRGRPISLHPGAGLVNLKAVCGLWIPCDDHDLILVHPEASTPHLEHIVLHEVGHMMCQHITQETPFSETSLFQGFLTQPGAVTKMLARTSYDTVAEREAEIFATVLGSRITASRPLVSDETTHDEVSDEPLTRLIAAMSKTPPNLRR